MPPAVAGNDEDRALAEDLGREKAHDGDETLVVGADERVVEEERDARGPRAEVAEGREPGREVELLARARRQARLDLRLRRDAPALDEGRER